MKILLLEDNSSDADLTKRGLLGHISNCTIQHASSLEEARAFLSKDASFDIALLDVNLPDGNGLEFLMEIRAKELIFPVIILTGTGDEDAAVSALKAGADDYIVKRFGYISQLPNIINLTILNYKKSEAVTSEIINVLYIEYYKADVDLTARHLAKYAPNIHVDAVATAEEALVKLESKDTSVQFDVILIDYRLLGMDAMEFIKTIRQKLKRRIPIILATSQGNEELAVYALKLGATDYLTKGDKYLYRLPFVLTNAYQHAQLTKKQEALVESESKYRLLADNSGDVIFVLDLDLNFTYISPAIKTLRGFEPEEALNHSLKEVLAPLSYEIGHSEFMRILQNSSTEGKHILPKKTLELEITRKDGSTVWGEVKASVILDKNNKPTGILGVTRDISERKAILDELILAKERAEESDRLKTAFLANMSHEIRTPMNGILGFASLLKLPDLSGESKQEFIDVIEKSGARMLNIIEEIVDISKIESGEMNVCSREININETVEYVYDLLQHDAKKKNIALSFKNSLNNEDAIIGTDREKLFRILSNLVKNAIKYTDSGTVEFGYFLKNNCIEFYVKDTGIGIPEERQTAIFERFIQSDIADVEARQGAGLGLSIAKGLVEMLGGKIWLESEEGKGSVFYFTINYTPMLDEEVTGNNGALAKEDSHDDGKVTLLIVDDDVASQELIVVSVGKLAHKVLRANSGLEAVEMCKRNPDIDLVFMDIQMPNMNGYEATQQIRQFNTDVIIIAQTAFAMAGDKEKAIAIGCNDYISKPLRRNDLIGMIQQHTKHV